MPNQVRPKCRTCDSALKPIFQKGPRGKAFVKVPEVFRCPHHGDMARGRRGTEYWGPRRG